MRFSFRFVYQKYFEMIDLNLYRLRIGSYNPISKSKESKYRNKSGNNVSSPCYVSNSFYSFILILYMYILILILAMTVDLKFPSESKFVVSISENIFPYKVTSLLDIRILLNLKFLIILCYYIKVRKRVTNFFPSFRNKGVTKFFPSFKNKGVTLFATLSSLFTVWLFSMNLVLLIICYPCIVNPGPVVSGLFMNVRGFVPFSGLNETVLPLNQSKILEFQSSVFSKDPGIIILNETWLSNDHSDNEILPDRSYKIYRRDRSEKSHPYDPNNPQKFRKKGGGVLIAIKANLDIESKVVGKRVKAEILSVELKCGNDIFCITTCYRVGNLSENNFGEVEKHLRSIAKIKKYKKHFFFGDLNLSNTSWPEGRTNNVVEKCFENSLLNLVCNK